MRRHRWGVAAALCALAVFAWLGVMGGRGMRRQLSIEVLSPRVEVQALAQPPQQDAPTVLIYHTHTWEAYEMEAEGEYVPTETWRTKDERFNMVRVGEALA